jgi:hypothetical protein
MTSAYVPIKINAQSGSRVPQRFCAYPLPLESPRMYAGKEATAEFGDFHSAEAVAHMAHFCIGDLVETSTTLP